MKTRKSRQRRSRKRRETIKESIGRTDAKRLVDLCITRLFINTATNK